MRLRKSKDCSFALENTDKTGLFSVKAVFKSDFQKN